MKAIEVMLAEQDRHKRSAIKALQAVQWNSRPGDQPWTLHEELLREAVLELWATITLMVEVQKLQRSWWQRMRARLRL